MKKLVLSILLSQLIVIGSYAQPGINDEECVNCKNNEMNNGSSALGTDNTATGQLSFTSGKLNSSTGDYSTTLGYGNTASGNYSLAGGEESVASQKWAFAFGQRAEADGFRSFAQGMDVKAAGSNSVVIGRWARTLTGSAMVIGYGSGPEYGNQLKNSIHNSLMIGFGSDTATFFVGPSDQTGFGKVGIGTSDPTTRLEVNGTFKVTDWSYFKTINLGGYDINEVDEIKGINGIRFEGVPSYPSQMVLDANGQLGIGTTTPNHKLDVTGNINFTGDLLHNGQPFETSKWTESGSDIYYNDGNVGIGTNVPQTSIDLRKDIISNGNVGIKISNPAEFSWFIGMSHEHSSRNNLIIGSFNTTIIGGTPAITIKHYGGGVGIGTSDIGNYKLAVAGKIRATEVMVEHEDKWYDYVFDDDYNLSSVKDLENYINKNKHLPDVPSATEVKENGINLGQMNGILLKKIEELTLYMIEQQKEIEELKKMVNR
ncbi:MAG: hypothetical protein B6D61_04800 [Bacteroidetes bacterium 4484_249]|nr:MAG: hypothetical protein B6D61_04800 [Bacteroidetes bacterium 4484_249]